VAVESSYLPPFKPIPSYAAFSARDKCFRFCIVSRWIFAFSDSIAYCLPK